MKVFITSKTVTPVWKERFDAHERSFEPTWPCFIDRLDSLGLVIDGFLSAVEDVTDSLRGETIESLLEVVVVTTSLSTLSVETDFVVLMESPLLEFVPATLESPRGGGKFKEDDEPEWPTPFPTPAGEEEEEEEEEVCGMGLDEVTTVGEAVFFFLSFITGDLEGPMDA